MSRMKPTVSLLTGKLFLVPTSSEDRSLSLSEEERISSDPWFSTEGRGVSASLYLDNFFLE